MSCREGLIYVYDLPSHFSDNNFHSKHAAKYIERIYGSKVAQLSDGTWLYDTSMFAAGGIFHARLRDHACRTLDPSQASLFFVPAYTQGFRSRPTEHSVMNNFSAAGSSMLVELMERVRVRGRCRRHHAAGGVDGQDRDVRADQCSALAARGGADHFLINPRNGALEESHPFYELNYGDPASGARRG